MTRAAAVLLFCFSTSVHANIIVEENARPGTGQWQLKASASPDIAGYASSTSVAPRERIRFYISTMDPSFTFEVFRMGWYGGAGGRRMTSAVQLAGIVQDVPSAEPDTGLIVCRWTESHSIVIPDDWVSGVYLAKLTAAPSGNQSYIMFVVRDERHAALLFQSTVTTYQAYNNWGGKSLYAFNSTGLAAKEVSFDRPYAPRSGGREFLLQWEYAMVRFLEREGYDVTYATNIDTHARPHILHRVKAFLSVGHDEYWTWEMRRNVETARDTGTHLGFFSANTCYWQIRLEDDGRTIVAHKESALATDPILHDGKPHNDHLATTLWRSVPVSKPEEALLGVMYTAWPVDADIVVENTSHWVFANTTLRDGDRLPGLLGYEVDAIHGIASPPNLVRLGHSPFTTDDGESGFSDMTLYTTARGAIVFATGSIQWSWGLDDYGPPERARVSAPAQQITRNVLDRMIATKARVRKRRAV